MFVHADRPFHTVAAARLFATLAALGLDPATGTCGWLVTYVPEVTYDRETGEADFWDDPELPIRECGAEAIFHDNGFECVAGHEHTTMEARERQGFDYAEDAHDAAVLIRGGRAARPMGPGTVINPGEVVRALATI